MADIINNKLRALDMTMLLVFSETMRRRKLSLVAQRLGLTQSAISHNVVRLRQAFGDPLFLRKPHGMEPTAFAVALEPKIRTILETAQESLARVDAFDPAQSQRSFSVAAFDYEAALFGPALCMLLGKTAPGVSVIFKSLPPGKVAEGLMESDFDLALGYAPDVPPQFGSQQFYMESYAVASAKRSGIYNGSLSSYLAARHALVSPAGAQSGLVDAVLAQRGKKRRVAAVFPLFLPALAAVAASDLIVTLPRRLAMAESKRFGLKVMEPPITLRHFPVRALWHPRNERDLGLQWLVSVLAVIAAAPP